MSFNIKDEDVIKYALSAYMKNTPSGKLIDYDEFKEDYQRFSLIVKIIQVYQTRSILNIRLTLNHIIVCGNQFGLDFIPILLATAAKKNPDTIPDILSFLHILSVEPKQKKLQICESVLDLQHHKRNDLLVVKILKEINDDRDYY